MVILLNKPYGYLSQFTPDGSPNRPLAELGLPPRVYAVGRLDADSEGMLILSSEKGFASALLDPERAHPREYWAQVDRIPDDDALEKLASGVVIQGRRTRRCRVWRIDEPELPPRDPPIRFRKNVPTAWIALELIEGKNRQVRRMTAAVGHPTLRLVRVRIGALRLGSLAPGAWRELADDEVRLLFERPERR
jgi:23S rRNA pseudouridine2457 synthase